MTIIDDRFVDAEVEEQLLPVPDALPVTTTGELAGEVAAAVVPARIDDVEIDEDDEWWEGDTSEDEVEDDRPDLDQVNQHDWENVGGGAVLSLSHAAKLTAASQTSPSATTGCDRPSWQPIHPTRPRTSRPSGPPR